MEVVVTASMKFGKQMRAMTLTSTLAKTMPSPGSVVSLGWKAGAGSHVEHAT